MNMGKKKIIYVINREELRSELKKSERKNIIISIIIAIITMLIGFYISYIFFLGGVKSSIELSDKSYADSLKLTETSLNKTFWMTAPVALRAESKINESSGIWEINITNTHPLKESGGIYLYKLEINPNKPSMYLNKSLKPGESEIFSLDFKSKENNITFNQTFGQYFFSSTIPASEIYYINEHTSISVKITCDSCSSQGIMLRVPDFNIVNIEFVMSNNRIQNYYIKSYQWVDYQISDILKQ